jgi:hypothetical protein
MAPNHSFTLVKGWFNDESVAEFLYNQCKDIALIHFDADLASSTIQSLKIIEPYLETRNEPMFFLFDDWGCHQDEVPDAFHEWLVNARSRFNLNAQKVSTTKLTRYYKITFNND